MMTGHKGKPLKVLPKCLARAKRQLARAVAQGARTRRIERLQRRVARKIAIAESRATS